MLLALIGLLVGLPLALGMAAPWPAWSTVLRQTILPHLPASPWYLRLLRSPLVTSLHFAMRVDPIEALRYE
jgi:hypothetical protein